MLTDGRTERLDHRRGDAGGLQVAGDVLPLGRQPLGGIGGARLEAEVDGGERRVASYREVSDVVSMVRAYPGRRCVRG